MFLLIPIIEFHLNVLCIEVLELLPSITVMRYTLAPNRMSV